MSCRPQHNAPSSIRPSHRPQNGLWDITPESASLHECVRCTRYDLVRMSLDEIRAPHT